MNSTNRIEKTKPMHDLQEGGQTWHLLQQAAIKEGWPSLRAMLNSSGGPGGLWACTVEEIALRLKLKRTTNRKYTRITDFDRLPPAS